MLIVADENIPYVHEAFSGFGDVRTVPGRSMSRKLLAEADILLVRSVTPVDAELLEGTAVRFVGTATIGTDHLDEEYLREADIAYASAPGSNAASVADYVTSAIIVLKTQLGLDLHKLTAAVIGHGNVGSLVEKRLVALGMRVLLNDPPRKDATRDDKYLPLEEVLERADVVTLHVPLTKTGPYPTYHMADEHFFSELIRAGTVFINTSRGKVVDENALLYARRVRKLRAAVLDVFHDEPDINLDILHVCDIATPHIAGYALDGKARGTMVLHEALAGFLGKESHWQMDDALPDPDFQILELAPEPGAVEKAVLTVYDLSEDDRRLRRITRLPEDRRGRYFDHLRKDYPGRREFRNTFVRFEGEPAPELVQTLEGLTFRVEGSP